MNTNLVSCVMVTKDRAELAQEAIQCYRSQSYQPRELVIVSQGNEQSNKQIKEFLEQLSDSSIAMVEVAPSISLASLRNLSVGIARGEFICQWDDDDLYHPSRIATHMRFMGEGVVASAYSQHLKYFDPTKEIYWIDWSQEYYNWQQMLCGAILFRKEAFRQFQSLFYPEFTDQQDREEDLNVLKKLIEIGTVVPLTDGYQYIYRFHGKNIYDLAHHQLVLKKILMSTKDLLANRLLLEQTFRDVNLSEAIVRDIDSIAFHYNKNI